MNPTTHRRATLEDGWGERRDVAEEREREDEVLGEDHGDVRGSGVRTARQVDACGE